MISEENDVERHARALYDILDRYAQGACSIADVTKAIVALVQEAILVEREECAETAAQFFVRDSYAIHPDIAFHEMNDTAQTVAHTTAQCIAMAISARSG